jgi:type II secretory pathway pseudopilin PulG
MSELTVQVIIVLLVLLAIVFGIIALGLRFILHRSPRIPGALAVMSLLMALSAPGLRAEPYSERAQQRIELQRQRIAPALERYRQEHGRYPSTLKEAGVKAPRTPYGRLHYFSPPPDMGIMYQWAYGNNEINGFEALWSTETGKWKVYRW